MNFQEYIEHLLTLLKDNPDLAESEVWTADDEEGNGYTITGFAPSVRYIPSGDNYRTESCYDLENVKEDVECEVYEEDYASEAEYKEAVKKYIEDNYKVVLLLN